MKLWSKRELNLLRDAVVLWYRQHGRPLPWRNTLDPYRIWVSEIMLQQTVVAAVIPYFFRFLESFPTVESLANADEQEVLTHWAGLGYYRRAKQLHAAAKKIRDESAGQFPTAFDEISSLPGVGRYTSGAIMSFAFDKPYPIVEANTQRLYARLLRLPGQMTDRTVQSELWKFAESFLPEGPGSGEANQAMMELGSQICSPKSPRCQECPLAKLCPTYKHSEQELIPTPKPPRIYEERREAVLLLQNHNQQFLMRRCEQGERWAGLWDFPRYDVTACKTDAEAIDSIQSQFTEQFGLSYDLRSESESIKHGVTRYKITLRCFHGIVNDSLMVAESKLPSHVAPEHNWCTLSEIENLPLNSTGKKLSTRLKEANVTKSKRVSNNKKTRKTHR
ncbi:A/G-specific adenine glycosylase [Pirellulaceae bacterium SH449]